MNVIELNQITKSYDGKKNAVDGVTFSVPGGSVYGFLGPNGAGKTTTVKLLSGLIQATSGSAKVLGMDPFTKAQEVHSASGLLTESAMMYEHITAMQNLIFYGKLFGMDDKLIASRASWLLNKLGLTDAKGKLKTFSTGMKQRLSLARVLLHDPKVLFLDEPTSGLDPESAQMVNDMIVSISKEGATVFICTHQLRYAQEICSSYGFISHGKLLAQGDIESLRKQLNYKRMLHVRATNADHKYVALGNGWHEVPISMDDDIPRIVSEMVNSGANIYEVVEHKMTLEDIYFAFLGNGGTKV